MIRKSGYRFSLATNAKRLRGDHAQTKRSSGMTILEKSHHASASGLIERAKKITMAAMQIRRQSLSLANMFSTLWRCRYKVLQYVAGNRHLARGGMQGVMPRPARAPRNASLS